MVQTRLKVGSFEAWAVVENEEVEHYDVDINEEEKLATCWIASTAGKHFGVYVVNRHDSFDCRAYLYLDGSRVHANTLLNNIKAPKLMDHVTVGEFSFRPFLFGALNLTEDESDTQMHEELGTIKVVIRRITNYGIANQDRIDSEPMTWNVQLREDLKIHESAKKLATHQVLFGETQSVPKRPSRRGKVTCDHKEIVATFTFRYRSLDMLKALDIVPCDPPPVETEGSSESGKVFGKRKAEEVIEGDEEKPEISDAEDEAQLEVALRSYEAKLEKIRQARLDRQQGKHAKKKVKCEPKSVFLPGEIIDLTI